MRVRPGALALALCMAMPAVSRAGPAAETVTGTATVVDGDTLRLAGVTVRLDGIDAPERAQTCRAPDGSERRCGLAAARALERLVAGGPVTCTGTARDPWGRLLGTCRARGADLAAALVLAGEALVFAKFSDRYAAEETLARKAGRGLWALAFETPWDWRAARWQAAAAAAPVPGCPIKGNIARDGRRLYHLPSDPEYLRTRIDAAKGERWFCDEAEAIRAGWRRAGG